MTLNNITGLRVVEGGIKLVHDFVVDPMKAFRLGGEDFQANHWAPSLSQHGRLRMEAWVEGGPSGLQGGIGYLNAPDECPEGHDPKAWALIWEKYAFLGFIQLPDQEEIRIQVFGEKGSFYEEYHHEGLFTGTVDMSSEDLFAPSWGDDLAGDWMAFFEQVLTNEFGAEPLDGHKWATCPCEFCRSNDDDGVCTGPK